MSVAVFSKPHFAQDTEVETPASWYHFGSSHLFSFWLFVGWLVGQWVPSSWAEMWAGSVGVHGALEEECCPPCSHRWEICIPPCCNFGRGGAPPLPRLGWGWALRGIAQIWLLLYAGLVVSLKIMNVHFLNMCAAHLLKWIPDPYLLHKGPIWNSLKTWSD